MPQLCQWSEQMTTESQDETPGCRREQEWIANVYAVTALALCIACPWVCWFFWGPWAGAGGIIVSHILYMLLLAPNSGICLGIPWIFVFFNGVLAFVGLAATMLWRMFR
jgi:hypothetical protein